MPAPAPRADIFIAYQRADRALVDQLAAALRGAGFTVATDQDVPPQADFGDVITEMIHAARLVLAVWTHGAAASLWVKAEARLALSLGRLLGLRLDEVVLSVPLSDAQMVAPLRRDLPSEDLARILAAVRRCLGQPDLPASPPEQIAQAAAQVQSSGNDHAAWQIAAQRGKAEDYEKYLRLHPQGIYAEEARAEAARALSLPGRTHRLIGLPQWAGVLAFLALIVAIWQTAIALSSGQSEAVVVEAPAEPASVQPSNPAPAPELVGAAELARPSKLGANPYADLLTPDWPLKLTRDQRGALLSKYACNGGIKLALGCLPTETTSVEVQNYRDLEVLPLLGKLENVTFRSSSDVSGLSMELWQQLAYLPNLKRVNLWDTNLRDLQPLSGLQGLEYIDVYSTQIDNLIPIARLNRLTSLDITSSNVSDLTPLAKLSGLRRFSARALPDLKSIAPLRNSKALTHLDIASTAVTDLTPLQGLTSLASLDLQGTPNPNLAPLADLPNLSDLTLPNGTEYKSRDTVAAFQKTLRGE